MKPAETPEEATLIIINGCTVREYTDRFLPLNLARKSVERMRLKRFVANDIEHGKPDRARRVMEEHCDDTAALLRGLLR